MSRIVIGMIILFSSVLVNGQLATVKSEFSNDSIFIGEQITYRLSVEGEQGTSFILPVFSDTLSSGIEILDFLGTDTTVTDGKEIVTQEYLVTSFDPGWNTVPPVPVVINSEYLNDTLLTTAALLTVLEPAVDTTKGFYSIKPPVNTPLSLGEIWPWILIIHGIMGLIALVTYYTAKYFRERKMPELKLQKQLEPADVIALRELEILAKEKLPQKGKIKEYYTRLSGIIRVYMERQFEIHAMESTTNEILEAFIARNDEDNDLNEKLENLLLLSDLVKFAKEDPLMNENELHMANAVEFVRATNKIFSMEEENEEINIEKEIEVIDNE